MKLASSIIFMFTAALLSLGMVMLVSASIGGQAEARHLIMQPIWCGIGLVACGLAAWKDYRHLRRVSWLLLGLAVVLLAAVLVPHVGLHRNGATRWIGFQGFSMQPSEFAKLALIIALAHYGAYYQRQMPTFWRGLVVPGAIMAPLIGLVFAEPDVGTAILLCAVGGILLILAGSKLRYLMPPVLAGMIVLGCVLYHDPMRSERIYSWLNLEETKLDKGLQAYQALVALGSGGIQGVGLGDGRQKLGFIPEHHTDFIFSIIGEELGLIATLSILVAFLTIVLSGVYVAWHARETFGMLLAAGITFLIGMQALINIAVVTSSIPNKGLPLPFISYGGSSLVVMMTGVGLLINVARHAIVRSDRKDLSLVSNEVVSTQFS
jgi:cell division protein FtsW